MIRKIHSMNVWALAVFYLIAGLNHFLNPEFYLPLIPDYLPNPEFINSLSGGVELLLAVGVLIKKTSVFSSYLIVLMLIGFIPAHIYFLQIGSCVEGGLCVPEWVSWVRLLLIQPFLIVWALSVQKPSQKNGHSIT